MSRTIEGGDDKSSPSKRINSKLSLQRRRCGFVERKSQEVEQRHTAPPHKSGVDGWMKMLWLVCWGKTSEPSGGPLRGLCVDYVKQKMHAIPSYLMFKRGLILL